jgi:hypothetical protein
MNEQSQETPKVVSLWARVKSADLDTQTGEVTLTPNVDAKYLIQELVREIQTLQQQVQKLEGEKPKVEETKDM